MRAEMATEIGTGRYFASYVAEFARREDNPSGFRMASNILMDCAGALKHPVSRQWKWYWQRFS